jgi:hypothetical protein
MVALGQFNQFFHPSAWKILPQLNLSIVVRVHIKPDVGRFRNEGFGFIFPGPKLST